MLPRTALPLRQGGSLAVVVENRTAVPSSFCGHTLGTCIQSAFYVDVTTASRSDVWGRYSAHDGVMSNALAVAAVTSTDGEIRGINAFLFQVTPNATWPTADLPTRRDDGSLVTRRQALDLHCSLTFCGDETDLEPQRLLGLTVGTLAAQPVLSRELMRQATCSTGRRTRSAASSTSTPARTDCSSSDQPRPGRCWSSSLFPWSSRPIIHADNLRPRFYDYLR